MPRHLIAAVETLEPSSLAMKSGQGHHACQGHDAHYRPAELALYCMRAESSEGDGLRSILTSSYTAIAPATSVGRHLRCITNTPHRTAKLGSKCYDSYKSDTGRQSYLSL